MPRWTIAALLVFVATVAAAYLYGIPMVARFAADRFPASVIARVDSETLAALDRQVFAPSALPAGASSSVLEASYSRDLEREADAYAIETLTANRIPLKFLADMLRRLDSAAGASGMPSALRYLSTHPATDERIRQLEGL